MVVSPPPFPPLKINSHQTEIRQKPERLWLLLLSRGGRLLWGSLLSFYRSPLRILMVVNPPPLKFNSNQIQISQKPSGGSRLLLSRGERLCNLLAEQRVGVIDAVPSLNPTTAICL